MTGLGGAAGGLNYAASGAIGADLRPAPSRQKAANKRKEEGAFERYIYRGHRCSILGIASRAARPTALPPLSWYGLGSLDKIVLDFRARPAEITPVVAIAAREA